MSLGSLAQTYTGSALTPTATTTPAGLGVDWTGTPQTNVGSYPVSTVNDPNYQGSASGTFVINKAPATVALSNLTQTYTGSALTPTATTTPAGLAVVWTVVPQTNAGSYPVTATISDTNYRLREWNFHYRQGKPDHYRYHPCTGKRTSRHQLWCRGNRQLRTRSGDHHLGSLHRQRDQLSHHDDYERHGDVHRQLQPGRQ